MKSEKGVTLSSLIIYVIAMSIIVGTVAGITNYFYGNINSLTTRTESSKEYTKFNSYFVNEVNKKDNYFIQDVSDNTTMVFSSGNQFKFAEGGIYYNRIKICKDVTSCTFDYDETSKKITVTIQINGKTFKNEYTMLNDI